MADGLSRIMDFLFVTDFWIAVGQIILIDVLLGGDNAVVIALACRGLPQKQRLAGILWGTAGAVGLRVILIFFALTLLKIPLLKCFGALLLIWIGIKLLLPQNGNKHDKLKSSERLINAIRTIIIADFVMSLDNVIAIAGAAEGAQEQHKMILVIFGLVVSIPIIVWGSQLVSKLMDRFPIIVTLGGMLLGWIAGGMAGTDPLVENFIRSNSHQLIPQQYIEYGLSLLCSLLVLIAGKVVSNRQNQQSK